MTSSAHSGYRIHHNLIMANTVAAYFRSSGVYPSSFDHNCLRENGWGAAVHVAAHRRRRAHPEHPVGVADPVAGAVTDHLEDVADVTP